MDELRLTVKSDHVLLEVHVVPRASKSSVQGIHDGKLKVSLAAPPVDGEANQALILFLAKALGMARRDVRIVRGETSRQKLLALHGVSETAVHALAAGATRPK